MVPDGRARWADLLKPGPVEQPTQYLPVVRPLMTPGRPVAGRESGAAPVNPPDYVVSVSSAERRWWVRLYLGDELEMEPLPVGPSAGLSLEAACGRCETALRVSGMYLLGGWQPAGIRHVRARVRKVRQLVRSGHMGAEVAG